jgi:hypothetical protein
MVLTTTVTEPLTLGRWQQPAALTRAGLAPPDPYPIQKILFCATCDQPFFGTRLAEGTRAYRSRCGCRLWPLPAAQVELATYAEAHRLTFGTHPTTGLTTAHFALLAVRLFARITLGSTVDDIAFTHRI